MPHGNRQRKTKQPQKAAAIICILVAAVGFFSPHRDKPKNWVIDSFAELAV
jgi:hypothetical protein